MCKNSRGQPKILGDRRVTINKLHTEDPHILGAIVQDLVSWRPGGRGLFVHFCINFKNVI